MRLHRNVYLWYVTTFFSQAAFTLPVWVIFNTHTLGLSYAEAFMLDSLPYIVSALCEVPTGSWADKYGRVRTFQVGTVLLIASVLSYVFWQDFAILAIFQVIGGVGLALQSGGLEALIHDSIDGSDKEAMYAKVHGYKVAVTYIARVVTVLPAGWLFAVNPRLPFILLAGTLMISLMASWWFSDIRRETAPVASQYAHIRATLQVLMRRRTLLWILGLIAINTFIAEALFALYQPYLASIHVTVGEFGIFYAFISVCSISGSLVVAWLIKRLGVFGVLTAMMLAATVTLVLLLLRWPWVVYVALIPSSVTFGMYLTVLNTSIQRVISSRHQATAVSIGALWNKLFWISGVLAVGVALDVWHISQIVAALATLSTLAVVIFVWVSQRQRLAAT